MFSVYGDKKSGNCYKVQLLLSQLGQPFEWIDVDIMKNESRTEEFLAKNANGKIPLLEIDAQTHLAESNAILCYLASGSDLLPADRLLHARVLQWLFFEQYSHEPYIATSRYIIQYLGRPAEMEATLAEKQPRGYAALDVMEQQLGGQDFLVGNQYSIADIGLYAYTHVAHEGGFDLANYPAIRAWFGRVEGREGFVAMGKA